MKGADAKVMSMLDDRNLESFVDRINKDLQTYSERGLRTLVFAFRPISDSEY